MNKNCSRSVTADNAFERIDSAPMVTLQTIDIPDSINRLSYVEGAEHLIDTANDAIEAFMLADQTVIENFVTCDFHLLDQAITWTEQNHLLAGNRPHRSKRQLARNASLTTVSTLTPCILAAKLAASNDSLDSKYTLTKGCPPDSAIPTA